MMPLLLKRLSHLTTALLLLVAAGPLIAQDPGATASGEKGAVAKKEREKVDGKAAVAPAEPAQPTQGLLPFGKMLPVGEKHLGLEIPAFKDGAPSSTVRAMSMTRVDDESMYLEKMDIKMYGPPDQSEKDLRVMMKTATYHMPSQILASDQRSRISRADFDLQGDSLIFDTVTGQGKMVGNVQMVIRDSSSLMKAPGTADKDKDTPAASKGEEASPAPPQVKNDKKTAKAPTPPKNQKK